MIFIILFIYIGAGVGGTIIAGLILFFFFGGDVAYVYLYLLHKPHEVNQVENFSLSCWTCSLNASGMISSLSTPIGACTFLFISHI